MRKRPAIAPACGLMTWARELVTDGPRSPDFLDGLWEGLIKALIECGLVSSNAKGPVSIPALDPDRLPASTDGELQRRTKELVLAVRTLAIVEALLELGLTQEALCHMLARGEDIDLAIEWKTIRGVDAVLSAGLTDDKLQELRKDNQTILLEHVGITAPTQAMYLKRREEVLPKITRKGIKAQRDQEHATRMRNAIREDKYVKRAYEVYLADIIAGRPEKIARENARAELPEGDEYTKRCGTLNTRISRSKRKSTTR